MRTTINTDANAARYVAQMPACVFSSLSVFALALAIMGQPRAAAQAKPDTFPATPPDDLPTRPYHVPNLQIHVLPNGLHVIVSESHATPMVTVRIVLPAGSRLNPPDSPGLAAAVANQLTAGTEKYSSLALAQAADSLGGAIDAGAMRDYTQVSASALSDKLEPLLALTADVLMHPAFPDSELATYKQLQLQSLTLRRQNPNFLAADELDHLIFGAHPYAISSTTPEALAALDRTKLDRFYRSHYVASGSTLIIVGDVKPDTIVDLVAKHFSSWSGTADPDPKFPEPPRVGIKGIYLIDRPGSVQSNILFGNLAIPIDDPDFFACQIASSILSRGAGKRLFQTVREKDGYAYDVRSTVSGSALAGTFTESAQTRTAVTAPALKEMLELTELIRDEPVSDKELLSAKNYAKGIFVIAMVPQGGLADRLVQMEAYHLTSDYLETYRSKIDDVTAADVERVARRYFRSDAANIVVVGDAEKLRTPLAEIGAVEEVAKPTQHLNEAAPK